MMTNNNIPGFSDPEKIFVNDQKTELILQLKDESYYTKNLQNNFGMVNLNQKAKEILENIISKSHDDLIKCIYGYRNTNRDYKTFIYDLFTLALFLEKLPPEFSKLEKINPDSTDLMHNRIHAQIAHYYQVSNNKIGIEKETLSHKKPDLNVDGRNVEIKTMLKRFENPSKYFENFKTQLEKGHEQVGEKGLVVIGMWSRLFNAVFKEYVGTSGTDYILSKNETEVAILLEGSYPLYDTYFTLPIQSMMDIMNSFCNEDGYTRIYNSMSTLNMDRNCFHVGVRGKTNIGFAFSVG